MTVKILALESTTSVASVSLTEDGTLRALQTLTGSQSHSVNLLPMIDSCLKLCGWSLDDLDLLACAVGPGSYTGVRIGVSTIKGLALSRHIPCVGVSSLEAMARQWDTADGLVIPTINARRNQAYSAIFEADATGLHRRTEDRLWQIPDLCETVRGYGKKIYLTGDAAAMTADGLPREIVAPVPVLCSQPSAYTVAVCAMEKYTETKPEKRSAAFAGERLTPVYLQKVQAEREREEKILREV